MNLILLTDDDFIAPSRVQLTDSRRVEHIGGIHRAQVGDTLKVGQLGGLKGIATVRSISNEAISLDVALTDPPPPASNISVILGLPRPPMLKRTLQTIATLGVKELVLLQSSRVEKSYWQSPQLRDENIHQELILGLEQAGDTRLPRIHFAKRFRPFMEDRLAAHVNGRRALIAHPYTATACPTSISEPTVLAIGPEGGFLDKELESFTAAGFSGVTLGPRIMRVETVVPYLLGKLSP